MKKFIVSFFAFALAAGVHAADDFTDWSVHMDIAVPGYNSAETLTNFPLLVRLPATATQLMLPGGDDLRFADSADNMLPREIETWDTNGVTTVWVRVPRLASGTTLRAYWGNPLATAPTDGANVWAGYVGVWHMNQPNNASHFLDSSPNALHGVRTGGTASVPGVGGAGRAWQKGNSGHMSIPNTGAKLDFGHTFTASGWFRYPDSGGQNSGNNRLFSRKSNWQSTEGWEIERDNETSILQRHSGGGASRVNLPAGRTYNETPRQWWFFTFQYKGSNGSVFINGVNMSNHGVGAVSNNSAQSIYIGANGSGGDNFWEGFIDEIRLETNLQSAAWIKACYDTMADPGFTAAGQIQSRNPIVAVLPATFITLDAATVNGHLDQAGDGAATADLFVFWAEAAAPGGPLAWGCVPQKTTVPSGSAFSFQLTGLDPDTKYQFCFLASNANHSAWTPVAAFTTRKDFSAWSTRAAITVSGYTTVETLENFPLLVRLPMNITRQMLEDGADLRFASSDNALQFPYEIETWDTNGTSFAWVKISRLTPGATFYAYWGNPAAAAPTDAADVWAEYAGVWHLNQTSGAFLDSTANALHGARTGGTGAIPGVGGVGSAWSKGNSGHVCVPWSAGAQTNFALNAGSTFTISGWFKYPEGASPTDDNRFFSRKLGYTDEKGWEIEKGRENQNNNIIQRASWTGSGNGILPNGWTFDGATPRAWYHLTFQYKGPSSGSFFANGVKCLDHNLGGGVATDNDRPLYFGSNGAGNGNFWQGGMDEIRLEKKIRSVAWVKACHDTMMDPLFAPVGVPQANNVPYVILAAEPLWTNVLFTATLPADPAAINLALFYGPTDGANNPSAWLHGPVFLNSATPVSTLSTNLAGLVAGTPYFARFAHVNGGNTIWGGTSIPFNTLAPAPQITSRTPNPEDAQDTSATVAGELTYTGGPDPVQIWLHWGTTDGGDTASAWQNATLATTLPAQTTAVSIPLSATLQNLPPFTTHHFRFAAANASGRVFSPATRSFTTYGTADFRQWGSRMSITVSGYTNETALANFPLCVKLPASATQLMLEGGADLRFADAAKKEFVHEIEKWDANGVSIVWVKVPLLTPGMTFYAYWRNPDPPPKRPASEVWEDYVGVWHLNQASGVFLDSTTNRLHATRDHTNYVVPATGVNGVSGTAAQKGNNGYITIPNTNARLDLNNVFAISGWFKQAEGTFNGNNARLFCRKNSYVDGNGWELERANNYELDMRANAGNSSSRVTFPGGRTFEDTTPRSWFQITAQFKGPASGSLFVNGELGVNGNNNLGNGTASNNGLPVHIGAVVNNASQGGNYWHGAMDEVRLEKTMRPVAWIKACHDTMADPLFIELGEPVRIPKSTLFMIR